MKQLLRSTYGILPQGVKRSLWRRRRENAERHCKSHLRSAFLTLARQGARNYEPIKLGEQIYGEAKRDWKERWGLIKSVLEEYQAGSVLDIGCAEGWFVRCAAEQLGCFAIGVEMNDARLWPGEISRLHDGIERCATIKASIELSDFPRLPCVDVVLCLSVLHHIIRLHGLEGARQFLKGLATRASKAIVIEMGTSEEGVMEWADQMPSMPNGQAAFLKEFLESAGLVNVRELGTTESIKRDAMRVLVVAEPPR